MPCFQFKVFIFLKKLNYKYQIANNQIIKIEINYKVKFMKPEHKKENQIECEKMKIITWNQMKKKQNIL